MLDYATAQLTEIDAKTLKGKTIAKIDASSCNVLVIEFTDGQTVAIESHHDFRGLDFLTIQRLSQD